VSSVAMKKGNDFSELSNGHDETDYLRVDYAFPLYKVEVYPAGPPLYIYVYIRNNRSL